MNVERGFRATLTVGDVTIERRDVEMLEALDECGSMHGAAEALGRSYARLQTRIVEIEDAVGRITERRRGGRGGGGTVLTGAGYELLREFDRHEVELDGVAKATESVFAGSVEERAGELATVATAAGPVLSLVPPGAQAVQIGVRSDAVVLTDPAEAPDQDGTSLRNRFDGTVERIASGVEVASVTVALADGMELDALLTRASVERLGLEPGRPVVASFKATAARAIRVD